MKRLFFNIDIFKGILAGFIIALGAFEFSIISFAGNGTIGFKALGAFMFSFGLCAICEEQLNLVTGKFGLFYDGSWSLHKILLIFITNLFGVFLVFLIRYFDANSNLVVEAMTPIITARDSKLWYQHILSGILCGACIQIAVYNYQNNKSYLGIILPVMTFILIGGEHCIADTFYYIWSTWSIQHACSIGLVFIGNFIGAMLVVATKNCIRPHFRL